MAQLKLGTSIGGHMALHTGNINKVVDIINDSGADLNAGKLKLTSSSTIGSATIANGALIINDALAIDSNEIYASDDIILGTLGTNVLLKKGTTTLATISTGGAKFAYDIYEKGTKISEKYLGKTSKAADSEKIDNYSVEQLFRRIDNTTDYKATANIMCTQQFDNKLPVGLSGAYSYGGLVTINDANSRLRIYTPHQQGTDKSAMYFATGWGSDNTPHWERVMTYTDADAKYQGKNTKASDSNLLDGLDSSVFLRSNADDSFSGQLVSSTRNKGIFGTYDSHKTDHIWSMGAAYKVHASGTNFGNLYGFAYKHTNNTTGGTMAGGHMAVWCQNGTPKVAMGDHLWTAGEIKGSSHLRITGNGYFSGDSLHGDSKQMIKFSDSWLRINDTRAFTSGIFCGSSLLRTDGEFQIGSSGSKAKITSTGDLTANNITAKANIMCPGDLKMTGTDSYIWTPHTTAGFTGFWDSQNSRVVMKYINNVGNIEFHRPTVHSGSLILSQGTGESNMRIWNGGATRGKVFEVSSPDSSSYAWYYQAGGSAGRQFSVNGAITASGNITAFSDVKLKENIKPIENALDKLTQIRGVTYDRKDTKAHEAGVIAQEVEVVLPEVVVESNGVKSVAYGNLNALLIEALKEEKEKREALETRLEALEKLLK